MKKVMSLLAAVTLLALVTIAVDRAKAGGPPVVQVNGGGTGLFVDPSVTPTDLGLTTNFSVGLTINDGSATGHFTCLVGGFVVIDGHYTAGSYDAMTGVATASGTGMEFFPFGFFGDGEYAAIPINFTNTFIAGGPGDGVFTLSADDGYFPVYPDDVDTEVVVVGNISIH